MLGLWIEGRNSLLEKLKASFGCLVTGVVVRTSDHCPAFSLNRWARRSLGENVLIVGMRFV
jgi:hypothetical protein